MVMGAWDGALAYYDMAQKASQVLAALVDNIIAGEGGEPAGARSAALVLAEYEKLADLCDVAFERMVSCPAPDAAAIHAKLLIILERRENYVLTNGDFAPVIADLARLGGR